jgi:acyl-CoA thioesterase
MALPPEAHALPRPGESSEMPPLDVALELDAVAERTYRLQTSEIYWNLTGPFGGWLFAAGAKAILADREAIGEPVEAHARFLAAAKPGHVEIRVERLSQGRSVAFWRAEIWQEQRGVPRLCTEISMLLASERATIDVVTALPPEVAAPDTLRATNTQKAMLRWLGLYDLRFAKGSPFGMSDPPSMHTTFWAKEHAPRPIDWLGLIALADIAAPRSFALQPARLPSSTVAMSIYFTAGAAELAQGDNDWLLVDVDGHSARRGFFDHYLTIWRGRQLLATSTQLAWFA